MRSKLAVKRVDVVEPAAIEVIGRIVVAVGISHGGDGKEPKLKQKNGEVVRGERI